MREVASEGGAEAEERVAGGNEEEVERPEAEERLVPEHADVGEEGKRVEDEEHGERRRVVDPSDRAGRESAEPDAEVHRHALLRERGVTARGRREPGDERRLARPEPGAPRAFEGNERKGLPRLAHEWQQPVADGLEDEPDGKRTARAEAVDERSGEDAGGELAG